MHTDPSSTAGNSLEQVPSSESLHVSHSSHVTGETLSEPNVDVEALDLESLDSRSSVKSTLACVGCYRRKTRCDGETPVCGNCQRLALNCCYGRTRKRRGPRAGSKQSWSQDSIHDVFPLAFDQSVLDASATSLRSTESADYFSAPVAETLVISDFAQPSPSYFPQAGPHLASLLPQVFQQQQNQQLYQQRLDFNSTPANSHGGPNSPIQAHIAEEVSSLRRFRLSVLSSTTANSSLFVIPPALHHPILGSFLPPDVISQLVHAFFEYLYPRLPIIHFSSFIQSFSTQSPLLLYAMFANCMRYCTHPTIFALAKTHLEQNYRPHTPDAAPPPPEYFYWTAGDFFFERFKELLPEYALETSSELATTILYACFYANDSGKSDDEWMLRGKAIRMAFDLKLNMEVEIDDDMKPLGAIQREFHRRIWWGLCELESIGHIDGNRVHLIKHSDSQCRLPMEEIHYEDLRDESFEKLSADEVFLNQVYVSDVLYISQMGVGIKSMGALSVISSRMTSAVAHWGIQFLVNESAKNDLTKLGIQVPWTETDEKLDIDYELIQRAFRELQATFPDYLRRVPWTYSPYLHGDYPTIVSFISASINASIIFFLHSRLSPYRTLDQETMNDAVRVIMPVANQSSDIIEALVRTHPQMMHLSPLMPLNIIPMIMVKFTELLMVNDLGSRKDTIRRLNILLQGSESCGKWTQKGSEFTKTVKLFLAGTFVDLETLPHDIREKWTMCSQYLQASPDYRFPDSLATDLSTEICTVRVCDLLYKVLSSVWTCRAVESAAGRNYQLDDNLLLASNEIKMSKKAGISGLSPWEDV